MPETVYIGLIVTSFTNQKLNTFTFSHVSVTGGAGGATVKPEAPLSLLASPSKQVQLRWTQSFGATNYSVKRATVKGGPYTTVGTGITNPSYVDTTVAADTTYHYVVTATNAAGESPVSMEDTVTTPKP
jgi:fibronectin type 3 domain-containing protein